MSIAKLTIVGIENYLNGEDNSLFNNISLPNGIEKELLTDTILITAGEYESLYSDPYFLKDVINRWFRTHYRTFDKWIKALEIEYDPLFNYDRTEEWTDDHEGSDSRNKDSSYSNSNKSDSTDKTSISSKSSNESKTEYGKTNTSELEVASYDSSSYENREQTTGTDSGSDKVTDSGSNSSDSSSTIGSTSSDKGSGNEKETGSDKYKNTHKGRMYGNIGVTTSQQMLQSELDIARFNIYEQIADIFVTDFCLLVA